MRFAFSDEQRAFQKSVRELLVREAGPAAVRAAWTHDEEQATRLRGRWKQLGDVGALGLAVPAAAGGLEGTALDWVLPLEEAGRAALPDPLTETLAVAAPLLAALAPQSPWLARIAEGAAVVTVAFDERLVAHAELADLVLARAGDGSVHALPRGAFTARPQPSADGARRLAAIAWTPRAETRLGGAPDSRVDGGGAISGHESVAAAAAADSAISGHAPAWTAAFDRAALAYAAELCGLGLRMLELTVEYVKVRRQFGASVGSFQAVKHHLADALVALEFARPLVYHAAWATATGQPSRARDVSMAKAAASDAATTTARLALQCHGAIGYSFEHDLHLWMKRAWALAASAGDAAWHRARVADALLGPADRPQTPYGGREHE